MSLHYDLKTLLMHARIDVLHHAQTVALYAAQLEVSGADDWRRAARVECFNEEVKRLRDRCNEILAQAEKAAFKPEAA